jgi:hypothetical protein
MTLPELPTACERVVDWLVARIVTSARGDGVDTSEHAPEGRFWLGRLAPEATVISSPLGDRSERMEPCAIGIRLRPRHGPPWQFSVDVSGCAWLRTSANNRNAWRKTATVVGSVTVDIRTADVDCYRFAVSEFDRRMSTELGADVLRAVVRVEVERGRDGTNEFVITLVNESPDDSPLINDTGIYQAQLCVRGVTTQPFLLESLPDSFRYDRRVPAYGINCDVECDHDGSFRSTDVALVDRARPVYWCANSNEPDFRFATLSRDPLPPLRQLVIAHRDWGDRAWSSNELDRRMVAEGWTAEMRSQAQSAVTEFEEEARRLSTGLQLLENHAGLQQAFRLMNESMLRSARGRYQGWRPFQIGFLLANIASILNDPEEARVVDVLWFATGGGKTETYLGLLLMAAFYDRLTGKLSGITAWSRFPLRLLSLQQTQRFADAIAAAEIVRRGYDIDGDPFALGFFVGESSTPNRIKNDPSPGEPDPLDDSMPDRFRVLLRCPFCDSQVTMGFNRRTWRLEHRCENDNCDWPEDALPFYVVDEEIYRFLPTIIVGTLDKVASISMQAAMKGFVSAPLGQCSAPGHGFTYAPRSSRPNGCLVPGCNGSVLPLNGDSCRFGPLIRLQDELHLLRDSLGAIDSHYESLLDHLESLGTETNPKIVASSATLSGFERQCDVLYGRRARAFPLPGPRDRDSFWSGDTSRLLRRYVAISPRGATLEFAADRIVTELQQAIRSVLNGEMPAGLRLSPREVADIVSLYGTTVIYGNTIRDIDASTRSLETQVPVSPLHTAQLTGQTAFDDVRGVLNRLQQPEDNFADRIHVVAASSMMSHGVDIDRLNSMVMLGIPLTTAEFIQATARIGRTWPGLVIVLHKMALERDASVFRSFRAFVEQGDRFVDAIPVTRRSRRVLERTLPGLLMARLRHVHEPAAGGSLTMITQIRRYFAANGITNLSELEAVAALLQWDGEMDERLRIAADELISAFFRDLNDPAISERFPDRLFATPVMRSLRDVEEQAPIHD